MRRHHGDLVQNEGSGGIPSVLMVMLLLIEPSAAFSTVMLW